MPLCPSCTLIDVKLLKASVAVPVLFKASFTELELSAQTGCPLCQLVKTTIEASTKSGNTKTPGRAVYYSAVEIKDPNTNIPSLNSLLVSCMGRSGYLILAPNKIPTSKAPRRWSFGGISNRAQSLT
jgi:hypothetical protein